MNQIRRLEKSDYYKGYLTLLEDLTTVNKESITFMDFSNRFNLTGDIYVVEHDNKIIASGTLLTEYKFIRKCGKVGHIEDIVIKKEYQGMGYGKTMIEYLTKLAKESGCYKVILDCDIDNEEFYEKCGFKTKGCFMAKYF